MRVNGNDRRSREQAGREETTVTFSELLNKCPEMSGLLTDALSIAKHERWSWYPIWLANSTIFHRAVQVSAEILQLPGNLVARIARNGLVDAYDNEKRRLARMNTPVRSKQSA